jgi:hypothetical protein
MRFTALFPVGIAFAALCATGCPDGGAGLGDTCDRSGDCASSLQCAANVCVPRCQRSPECGAGFQCTSDGLCVAATAQSGDACTSETDCAAGLACQLDGSAVGSNGQLLATCGAQAGVRPADAACGSDADCRDGTCALGRCVDLCAYVDGNDDADTNGSLACVAADSCTLVPRVGAGSGALFGGCLPTHATITWSIPVTGTLSTISLPVPKTAQSIALSMQIDDPDEEVGALRVADPTGVALLDDYGSAAPSVRHTPGLGQAVLAMPSNPDVPLVTGTYAVEIASLRAPFFSATLPVIGSSTPSVTAIAKLGQSDDLDLHFYFLDFTDHPCAANIGPDALNAAVAASSLAFQNDYVAELRRVFALGGISLDHFTYEDITDHAELDGLDVANAPALLALGTHASGINVFFVRTLSPVGLQTFGPTPGPAGLAQTGQSGVIVGADTLCYRTWTELARLTAHELAHYMGLYDNVTLEGTQDPIGDTGSESSNLMFYSELDGSGDLSAGHGVDLSAGQQNILARSAVLQ